jgi:hypothetical protein
MEQIPTPDLAVPYAAPKQVKTMADVQPMAPKNGYNMSVGEEAQSNDAFGRHRAGTRQWRRGLEVRAYGIDGAVGSMLVGYS